MKKRKVVSLALVGAMALSTACNATTEETTKGTTIPSVIETSATETEEDLPYEYGLGTTFHADEPVTYTMYFSDASWYPMIDTWESEGVFAKIEELTNVNLELIPYDSSDYNNNIGLDINAGDAAYIIPKVYDDQPYIDGGAILPVSNYVQYMPNYIDFYNTYDMSADLKTITRSDGCYYRLPGMLEQPLQDYTFMIRSDIFEAAGVDVASMEEDWTWDDLLESLITVKEYMVEEGMCSEDDYIWSDLWCGNESGQGSGGNLLKLMGASFDVNAGWAVGDGMRYDQESDSWYFSPTDEAYKDFLECAQSFVNAGILDPETFTQDDATATAQFYNGQTVIMSVNRGQYSNYLTNLDATLGAGNYETYLCVIPQGNNNYMPENNRLENGVMISQNALDDLGEDGLIEMLRFVDWLWYSPEAYSLIKWGVEGETYEVNDDGSKSLLDGFCCSGLGITGDEDDVDIRLQWGYAGGNFFYGHTVEEMTDNFIPAIQDFTNRELEYRDVRPIAPGVAPTSDQNEQINLIKTPLIDNVNTWTLMFITGQADIEEQWDEYVASCEGLNSQGLTDLYNEVYQASK